MRISKHRTSFPCKPVMNGGFTLIEVIIAGGIMIILCIGTLTVFSHATKINSINNMRSQAQSVLQQEAEYYRSLKFIPVGSDAALNIGTFNNIRIDNGADCPVGSPTPDSCRFNISVAITNLDGTSDPNSKFKQIAITALPRSGNWPSSLGTNLTIQRVRAN